jgi:hypothetical protein
MNGCSPKEVRSKMQMIAVKSFDEFACTKIGAEIEDGERHILALHPGIHKVADVQPVSFSGTC